MVRLKRGDFLYYADIGLCGTFVDFHSEQAEEGYVKFRYVPFGSRKKILHPIPVKKEYIKNLVIPKNYPGVEERQIIIFTDEPGSVWRNIVETEHLRRIKELQEQNVGLKKQIASLRQEASDAQSGVSKTIEKLNTMKKSQRDGSPFSTPFGERSSMPGFNEELGGGF